MGAQGSDRTVTKQIISLKSRSSKGEISEGNDEMARSRYLKPAYHEDTKMAEISVFGRYLYASLWCYMDRDGITENDVRLIKSRIFPHDTSDVLIQIQNAVKELTEKKRLFVIEHDGEKFLYCPKFKDHQKIYNGELSKFKIPKSVLADTENQGRSQLRLDVDQLEVVRSTSNELEVKRSEKKDFPEKAPNSNSNLNSNLNLNSNSNGAPVPAPRRDVPSIGPTGKLPARPHPIPRNLGPPPVAPHEERSPETLKIVQGFFKKMSGASPEPA